MRLSNTWFPTTLQAQAGWFNNFANQFASVGASLGFTPEELAAVDDDNQVFQFLATNTKTVNAYHDAFRQYRNVLLEGNIGDPAPAYPPALPAGGIPCPTGIFARLQRTVAQVRSATNYTTEIGALLGILPPPPPGPSPESEMKPNLSAVSMPGNVVEVKFVRGKTDGISVETKIDNAETWSSAGKFIKSPASLVIPENPSGLPRSVQIRARYVEGNSPVGQYSPAVTTATQPAA